MNAGEFAWWVGAILWVGLSIWRAFEVRKYRRAIRQHTEYLLARYYEEFAKEFANKEDEHGGT